MKREAISLALNRLDERHISDTVVFSPGAMQDSPERIVFMKKKRIITFALAAVLMLSLVAVAYAVAGVPRWTATHVMKDTGEYTSLADLEKIESVIGYDVSLVERFSNGYEFSKLLVGGEAVYDEDYTVLKEYYAVYATYAAPGRRDIILSISPLIDLENAQESPVPDSVIRIDETEVNVSRDHYKFVPPDYEKTPEDLTNEASGHYYISFGADEIKEEDNVSAVFVRDGAEYCFLCSDAAEWTDEMLVQMASELIKAA